MVANAFAIAADLLDPPPARPHRWPTPGAMAQHFDPRTVQTPALQLIDERIVDAAEGRADRQIFNLPPQEGKTTKVSVWTPLWLLEHNPDLRIGIVSFEMGLARIMGGQIRDLIATYGAELGLTVRPDTSAKNEWRVEGHAGGVYATGIGGSLTGRPLDVLIIDDPIKDWKAAQSQLVRDAVWLWWQSVGFTRLAPGAIVMVVQTRWHHDDLTGRLTSDPESGREWRVLNIPALADHDPAQGQADPLGRQPGEWLDSARGRTPGMWERIRRTVGSRVFAALHQGRPSPVEGDVLQRGWWSWYEVPRAVPRTDGSMWLPGPQRVATSWDMTFKRTDTSDYVVGQVWSVDGANAYLLDQVRDRMSFTDALAAFVGLARKWPQANAHYVEDKANGPAVMSMLRNHIPGILPVEPRGSKEARAQAIAPLVQAGNVWLPDPQIAPWVMGLVEEAAAFPNGAHDDQVDTLTQALSELLLDMTPSADSTTWYSLTRRRGA